MQTDELLKKGISSWNLGNPKEAGKIFDQVLVLDPNHKEALVRQGNVLGRIGKYAEAITYYNRALKLDPKNILALVNKGLSLHYLSNYSDAISCYDQVLTEKPRNTIAIYNKASSLVKKGDTEQGLHLLAHIIKIDYSFKSKAKFDIDFQHLRGNPNFEKIIG